MGSTRTLRLIQRDHLFGVLLATLDGDLLLELRDLEIILLDRIREGLQGGVLFFTTTTICRPGDLRLSWFGPPERTIPASRTSFCEPTVGGLGVAMLLTEVGCAAARIRPAKFRGFPVGGAHPASVTHTTRSRMKQDPIEFGTFCGIPRFRSVAAFILCSLPHSRRRPRQRPPRNSAHRGGIPQSRPRCAGHCTFRTQTWVDSPAASRKQRAHPRRPPPSMTTITLG